MSDLDAVTHEIAPNEVGSSVFISVAICTYNGAARLPAVLDALWNQTCDRDDSGNVTLGDATTTLTWEVLVVDNNSTDSTAEVVARYATRWRDISAYHDASAHRAPLRYLFEPRQGTTYARQRAFREARGTWIGLLDDDNIPPPTWFASAAAFIEDSENPRPHLGAFGGNIFPKLESEPPPDFDRISILLAVYDRGDRAFQYRRDAPGRIVPAAPGSFVRRQAWFETVPFDRLLLGGRDERGGTFLGACEDLEALFYLQNSAWEVWHTPDLWVEHHLLPHRFDRDYLIKVARTSGLSNHALRIARLGHPRMMRWRVWAYFVSDGLKLLRKLWETHTDRDDLAVACDRAASFGRWLSPIAIGWHDRIHRQTRERPRNTRHISDR